MYIEGNPVDEEVFQDWDMWTTCYDMEEIIAPNMRITRFAKEWRMWAAAGLADYLVEQGDVRSEILDSYVKDLKENRSSYEVLLLENKKVITVFHSLQFIGGTGSEHTSESVTAKIRYGDPQHAVELSG